ncbi:MAG: flagellar hook assembly protein FlgD [Betaproteobacteria bacterium]|nr:flagellar hook assembly protein FlgD [Betaproteobacteria bacterium]
MSIVPTNTVSPSLMATMNPSSASSTASTAANSTTALQNQFMTLLVTQLKNQDPTNPMDNAQITSQMAQLSTVTGVQQLNTSIQSLLANNQASQSLQAANMIGQNVLVNGSSINYTGSAATFGVNLASAADSMTVTVLNGSGQKVDSYNLGAQPAGIVPLQWDGTTTSGAAAPNGAYTFQVSASLAGTAVAAQPLSYGAVTSVANSAQGVQLEVAGIGAVSLANVAQIF